jgi:hypothetical protein
MGIVGFAGLAMILPFKAAIAKMAITPYDLISSYTFATIPCLLSWVLSFSLPVRDRIFLRLPGNGSVVPRRSRHGNCCGVRPVWRCLCFCHRNGSHHGLVALPALKEYKYDTGSCKRIPCRGGPIGSLIPPSGSSYLWHYLRKTQLPSSL